MDACYDGFAAHLRRRGFSERTLDEYLHAVSMLESRLKGRAVAKCSREELKAFQQWLAMHYRSARGAQLSGSSQGRIVAGIAIYFRFLCREGLRFDDPGGVLIPPKVKKALPRLKVSLDEVMEMLDRADGDPGALRARAAAWLFAVAGLRASELCGLDLEDVDLEHREVHVRHGKGDKARMTFITAGARDVLARYLAEARPKLLRRKQAALFLGNEGKRWTRHLVYVAIRQLGAAAGIKLYPHQLRHLFCTAMLRGGADIRTIGELAGHIRLSTTARYIRVDDDMLKKVYEQTHPRSR